MRRSVISITVALALGLGASLARAEGDGRTFAVVVDRSAQAAFADPAGEGRAALAFAVALAARPLDEVAIFVPGHDRPVATQAKLLQDLSGALRTLAEPPLDAGGVELGPSLAAAATRAGEKGAVLLYTSDELEVVDARGRAPKDALDRARASGAPIDRKAVNEAARALLAEALPKDKVAGRFFALRTPLPEAARSVPFLETLGAQPVDLDPGRALETTRRLVVALGGADPGDPRPAVAVANGEVKVDAEAGARIALVADKGIKVSGGAALQLDGSARFWLVDATGPITVNGDDGTQVSALAAARARIALTASAWRLATGKVFVRVVPKQAHAKLVVRVGETDLVHANDAFSGRVDAPADATSVTVSAGPDAASLLGTDAPIAAAKLTAAVDPATPPMAGARTTFLVKGDGLPDELFPRAASLLLENGKETARVELARTSDGYKGEGTIPAAGEWKVVGLEPNELAVEAPPVTVAPAPTLTVTRVGEGPVTLDAEGVGHVELALELAPAMPYRTTVRFEGGQAGTEAAELPKGHARVKLVRPNLERATPIDLIVRVELERGASSEGHVSLELRPAFGWKKIAALGLLGVAVLWVAIVMARRRALDRRFGTKQLRGIGSNGKLSYERYLLRDNLDTRTSAVLPQGATAVRIELDKEGRATAQALDGSFLMGAAQGVGRVKSLAVVHETPFLVVRELYSKRFVYLEQDPSAEELLKRYVADAPSYDPGESRDSDVFVLLEDKDNMVPPSARLTPVESARLPNVKEVIEAESDETVIVTDSTEEKVIDDPDGSLEGRPLTDVDVLDPGSSDDSTSDPELDPTTSSSSSESEEESKE